MGRCSIDLCGGMVPCYGGIDGDLASMDEW